MEFSHHVAAGTITELDLSVACHPNTITDRINAAVPGLRTSAAFFTFLRANLVLPPSAISSNMSTPILEPTLQASAPASSPGAGADSDAVAASTALDDIPPLSLDILTKQEDKVDALHLVADSIAQQRQQASLNLVFHPLLVAGLVATMALVYQWAWVWRNKDLGALMSVMSGAIMAYLLTIRMLASGYLTEAEKMNWDWLVAEDGEEDVIIGARFGEEIIGALVLRLEPNPSLAGKKKNRSLILKGGRGVIRAWTTRLRYRKRGMGTYLLEEAVKITRERCGKEAEIGFAQEHANSKMVLPEMFNAPFRKREMKAAKALESVLADWDAQKRKR